MIAGRIGANSEPAVRLYYQTNNAKPVLIWPFLEGEIFYTNQTLLFGGFVRDEQGRIGDMRYFAALAPGPALDISDDLLKRFADSNKLDFATVKKKYSPLKWKGAGQLKVHFLGPDQQPNDLSISWQELSNIVQNVRETGKPYFVEDPHTPYLKKDY